VREERRAIASTSRRRASWLFARGPSRVGAPALAAMDVWAGCWRREALWEPRGSLVPTEHVTTVWLQSGCGAFVDVRAPNDGRTGAARLAETRSFAGTASYDAVEGVLTWRRGADFRGPPGAADAGRMRMVGTGVVVEESVLPGDDYAEEWRSDGAGGAEVVAQGLDAGGERLVTFVVVGGWWGLSVGRRRGGDDGDGAVMWESAARVWAGGECDAATCEFVHGYVGVVGRVVGEAGHGGGGDWAQVVGACGPAEVCTDERWVGATVTDVCVGVGLDLSTIPRL